MQNSNATGKSAGGNPDSSEHFIPNEMGDHPGANHGGVGAGGKVKARAVKIQPVDKDMTADVRYFEATFKELISLAKNQPLRDKHDLARAKELMRSLRQMGFSSKEIEGLTGHAWQEPTIKQYTQGVRATESDVKDYLVGILVRAINTDTGLQDVADVAQMKESLAEQGIELQDVADLVKDVSNAPGSPEINELVEAVAAIRESGVGMDALLQAVPYIAEMSDAGSKPDDLGQVARASQKLGGLSKVMDAISAHGSLQDIQEKIRQKKEDYKEAHEQLTGCQKQLEEARATIEKYEELEKKGYDTGYLDRFGRLVAKYGGNKMMEDQALERLVGSYMNMEHLLAGEKEAQKKAGEAEHRRRELEIKYAAEAKSIEFANELLFKYKFNPEMIGRLLKQTRAYGGLEGFLSALEMFSGMEELENKIHTLRATITHLKTEQEQRTISLQEVTGKLDGAAQFHQALAGTVVDQMRRQAEQSIQDVRQKASEEIARMEPASRRYAEITAKTKAVEEELKIARYVTSVAKYPEEARGLPPEWGYIFILAGLRFVQANNINPSASGFPAELVAKHPDLKLFGFHTFTLQEILAWALMIAATDAGRLT